MEPPPTKLLFASTPRECKAWEGRPYVERMQRELAALGDAGYQLVESAADSDLVIYFEPHYQKDWRYADVLLAEEAIRDYPEKCFTVNYDFAPLPHLPGVYVSMPRNHFDRRRFRAGGYPSEPNRKCREVADAGKGAKDLLASFRGKKTAKVRSRLFEVSKEWGTDFSVVESHEWFDHAPENQRNYALEIQRSLFAICPRGFATSSYRLYEAMQLSTAPVILADDWVAPDGPDWNDFLLRVTEDQVEELPGLLRQHATRAEEMGRKARTAWEDFFCPRNRIKTMLRSIEELRLVPNRDEASLQKHWRQPSFYTPVGMNPSQMLEQAATALKHARQEEHAQAVGVPPRPRCDTK